MSQPERQAWALSYAMRARPSPALASRYFDALKRMLGADPVNVQGQNVDRANSRMPNDLNA